MYDITDYSYKKAKKLNVDIKPSVVKGKKIDVFKDNKKIASIGALGMGDYPTYIREKGLKYANERRRLYRLRHKDDLNNKEGSGYWASEILW
jgi:hypothetical protein